MTVPPVAPTHPGADRDGPAARRRRRDRLATAAISLGGWLTLALVGGVFVYLVAMVWPLLSQPGAGTSVAGSALPAGSAERPLHLAIADDGVWALDREGLLVQPGMPAGIAAPSVAPGGAPVVSVARVSGSDMFVALDTSGRLWPFTPRLAGQTGAGQRGPDIERPHGAEPLLLPPGRDWEAVAAAERDGRLVAAARAADGGVVVIEADARHNLLTGATHVAVSHRMLEGDWSGHLLALGSGGRWLYLAGPDGVVRTFTTNDWIARGEVRVADAPLVSVAMLAGDTSLAVGDAAGGIARLLPIRPQGAAPRPELAWRTQLSDRPIAALLPEARRRSLVAVDGAGNAWVVQVTGQRQYQVLEQVGLPAALSAAGDRLAWVDDDQRIVTAPISNPHPEISTSSLWQPTWYDGYPAPAHVWQSTSANEAFEPKFGLVPLTFGTIKAAFYALLFALPLAVAGAAYTAFFMSPGMREWIKPSIEVMEALPTVILGFLAGLWFAPWLERHLFSFAAIMVVVPLGVVALGSAARLLPVRWRTRWAGRETPWLMLAIIGLAALALALAAPLEAWWFDGDLRGYLNREFGIGYQQRNALVVGCAMGFAVIPTVFSLCEDAIHGVPATQARASIALGATPMQTLVRVVLPIALPGILSAIMVGAGRAVGETMIVLMATGNTPLIDWSPFDGMRTLAANLAIEMPRASGGSSHARVLFLSALVLFVLTFVLNSAAELIRQRLRQRYRAL